MPISSYFQDIWRRLLVVGVADDFCSRKEQRELNNILFCSKTWKRPRRCWIASNNNDTVVIQITPFRNWREFVFLFFGHFNLCKNNKQTAFINITRQESSLIYIVKLSKPCWFAIEHQRLMKTFAVRNVLSTVIYIIQKI